MNPISSQQTYQHIVILARQLPLTERIRLVRDILAEPLMPEQEAQVANEPLETMYGMFAGQGPVPSQEEIQATRREMWSTF